MRLSALMILAACVLAGCAVPVKDPTAITTKDAALNGIAPEKRVRLQPAIADLVEEIFAPEMKASWTTDRFATGREWTKIFTGDASAMAELQLVSSRLERTTFERVQSEVRLVLRVRGAADRIIVATGSGTTSLNVDHAAKRAIDACILDALQQVRVYLSNP